MQGPGEPMETREPPRLHDVPTAAELVVAVREFLETVVADEVTGATRFHVRVAANALAMVEREQEQGGVDVRAHVARLSELGCSDDAALAAALRTGELDHRSPDVIEAITADVVAKLRVANPAYLQEHA